MATKRRSGSPAADRTSSTAIATRTARSPTRTTGNRDHKAIVARDRTDGAAHRWARRSREPSQAAQAAEKDPTNASVAVPLAVASTAYPADVSSSVAYQPARMEIGIANQ